MATETFKEIVWNYLLSLAEKDEAFSDVLQRTEKSIDDCVAYIINQVKKIGRSGFADEEIYSMAVHFYMEDDIEVGEDSSRGVKIVVNEPIQLSEEDKKRAYEKALEEYQKEIKDKLSSDNRKKPKREENRMIDAIPNLFEDEAED